MALDLQAVQGLTWLKTLFWFFQRDVEVSQRIL